MRSLGPLLAASALALTAVAPRPALASPEDLFGYGARSNAMGGLGATFVDDYAAVHANPAGLSRGREASFTLGYVAALYSLWTARPTDAAASPMSIAHATATTIGLTVPLPFGGVLRDRIGVGLGFYTPTDVVVRGRILRPEQPQFLVLADRAQSVALQLGLGIDLSHGLRIGAGFAALAAITGSVVIQTDSTGRVGSRVDDQLIASYAPIVGASWDVGPLRVAAVYRGTLVARFGVTIAARDIGLPLPDFNIAGIAQYDPWQVALETAYAKGPWTAALGATFKRWSEYPGPLEATTAMSTRPPSPNFADTWVLRAGAEHNWRLGPNRIAARLGYFYEPTPSTPVRTPSRAAYLDNDRHVATVGLALGAHARGTSITAEFFGQLHFLVPRESITDASGAGPVTQSIRYGGAMYFLGMTLTVSF